MKKGVLQAVGAYLLWGFMPIYFKLLKQVPSLEMLANRFVWSFVTLMIIVVLRGELKALRGTLNRRLLLLYGGSGLLLAINWLVFIISVNSGRVLDASLGYFMNPLVSVVLGMLIFKEKLRPLQWTAVGLAALGVLYLAFTVGTVPWAALALAFTFGFYGVLKKIAPLSALHGLTLETAWVLVPTAAIMLYYEFSGTAAFGHSSPGVTLLLFLGGLITIVPLMLFSAGAQTVPLTVIGLLQFIAPTMQFMVGTLLYNEPMSPTRLVGFAIIWTALVVFSVENVFTRRRALAAAAC